MNKYKLLVTMFAVSLLTLNSSMTLAQSDQGTCHYHDENDDKQKTDSDKYYCQHTLNGHWKSDSDFSL